MMTSKKVALILWLMLSILVLAQDDLISKKLEVAKEAYDKSLDQAKNQLIMDLKKKADFAQKSGNLSLLERYQAETKSFEESNIIPKSIPTKLYELQIKTAKSKIMYEYNNAIKQYTKSGKIDLAKFLQNELELIINDEASRFTSNNPFIKDSVWISDSPKRSLSVTSKSGDKFRAIFISESGYEREVNGIIKGEKISWLSKDVRVIKGNGPGGDNFGTIVDEKNGNFKIDFIFGSGNVTGKFSLYLQKK